jgi:urate oxidase
MTIELTTNNYGKSGIRLVRVTRDGQQHDLKDIVVAIQFEGDFGAVHTHGDNSKVLPTDTMKNTVYALAGKQPVGEIEEFAQRLIAHFIAGNAQISRVRISVSERPWARIPVSGKPHASAFLAGSNERRIAEVSGDRKASTFHAGIDDLLVLRTAGSGFSGYIKDAYTTLPETNDRIFSTVVKARWRYSMGNIDFGGCFAVTRVALLETFASHKSESVQHTLYAMAESALQQCPQINEIHLSMPNKHHLVFDLARFGMENRNEVFVPTDEPYGLIEATVRRK